MEKDCAVETAGANIIVPKSPTLNTADRRDEALHVAADKLEAGFLAEMLKSAGVGKAREAFGGGVGEDQFGDFMVDEQARMMVAAGGIGLSEQLFEALKQGSSHGS